jgi:two-component system, NtrC family, response regulator HydG
MRASDLRLDELVTFEEGAIRLQGRRLVLHSIDAFAQSRRDMLDMLGLQQTRRILTRFGYFSGQADAAAVKRIYPSITLPEWLKAGPRFHSLLGVTRSVIKTFRLGPNGQFVMELTWHESGEVEEHLARVGPSTEPVCWMLAGYASGYASYCLDAPAYFLETGCRACGGRVCNAVGKDEKSWGKEFAGKFAHFQADDIKGKIQKLSRELRLRARELVAQRQRLESLQYLEAPAFPEVHAPAFLRVLQVAERAARFDASVLITGESGVGKEVLARHMHGLSPRHAGPFVAINCGAVPETLLESELFGHAAGAYTGAQGVRVGLFEQAQHGTLFLDEIGEVPASLQVKLLRVLQEREVLRLGENQPRKIDVRVIAATNRDVARAIQNGSFREDLYYRIAVMVIEVPPLRERREDIVHLARRFVQRAGQKLRLPKLSLHASCVDRLECYDWPGNVRELENAIEHAAVLCTKSVILPEHLPRSVTRPDAQAPARQGEVLTLAEAEQRIVLATLDRVDGNRTKAAELLGISQTTLWRRLREYEARRPSTRAGRGPLDSPQGKG